MVIHYRSNKVKIARLKSFSLHIYSYKNNGKIFLYNCQLLSNKNLISTGTVKYKHIENEHDMVSITRIFLNHIFQEDDFLEEFCRKRNITTFTDFFKITKEYFDNSRRINNLPNSSYVGLIDFLADLNGENIEDAYV